MTDDDKIMRTYCIAQGTLLNALWWFQMGRKSKKEGIYVNIWLIHFAIQQKLIHYKATILQWKKKKWNTKSKQKRINQSSKNLVERTVWLIFFLPLSTLPTQLSESLIQNRCPICVCRINICFLSYAKKKKRERERDSKGLNKMFKVTLLVVEKRWQSNSEIIKCLKTKLFHYCNLRTDS